METESAQRATILRDQVREHPVASYLIVMFTVAWTVLWPSVLLGLPVEPGLLVTVYLGQLLPATLITAAEGGRPAVRELFGRTFRWRAGPARYATALLALPVVALLGAVLLRGVAPVHAVLDHPDVVLAYVLALSAIPIINLAEETGWMFVQSRLMVAHGPLRGSAVTGLFFAGLHLPLYVDTTSLRSTLAAVGISLLVTFPFRFVIGSLYRWSGASVLPAALFHGSFNALNTPDLAGALFPGVEPALVVAGATLVLAAVVLRVERGRR